MDVDRRSVLQMILGATLTAALPSVSLATRHQQITYRQRRKSFVLISGSKISVSNVNATEGGIEFDVRSAEGELFEQPVFQLFNDSDVATVYVVTEMLPRGMEWTVAAVPSP